MNIAPLVSIGLPVRNGENYLRQALDSLLAQTFADFEIVICDNCSTDLTRRICLAYAARDGRVRYFRNGRDVGPADNYTRCFELSRGKYFRWHAHDDMAEPRHLEECVRVLERDPAVVNCHTFTRVIGEHGEDADGYALHVATGVGRASARFGRLIGISPRLHRNYEVFGLMRREAIAAVPPQGAFPHADRVFLVRVALRGRFEEVPEPLFLPRSHPAQSMQQWTTRSRFLRFLGTGPLPPAEWWDPSKKGKVVWPEWKLLREYWKSIGPAPVSAAEAMRCRAFVVLWAARNLPKLIRDLAYAVEHVLTGGPREAHHPLPGTSAVPKSGVLVARIRGG